MMVMDQRTTTESGLRSCALTGERLRQVGREIKAAAAVVILVAAGVVSAVASLAGLTTSVSVAATVAAVLSGYQVIWGQLIPPLRAKSAENSVQPLTSTYTTAANSVSSGASCVPPPCGRTLDGGISGFAISHSPSGTIQLHVPRPIPKSTTTSPRRTRSKTSCQLVSL